MDFRFNRRRRRRRKKSHSVNRNTGRQTNRQKVSAIENIATKIKGMDAKTETDGRRHTE